MATKIRFPKWMQENDMVDHNDPKIKMFDELRTMDYSELVGIAEADGIDYTEGMSVDDLAWMIADESMKISVEDAMKDDGKLLESLPVGTKITGVTYKRSGMEVIIEKRSGYRTGWDLNGMVGRAPFTEWAVAGYEDPYIKRTLREVLAGTNKYYNLNG